MNAAEQAPGTGPCYGCGEAVAADYEHTVTRHGDPTLCCDDCRHAALMAAFSAAEGVLTDVESVANALRNLLEGKAEQYDVTTMTGWMRGSELSVGGDADWSLLCDSQKWIAEGRLKEAGPDPTGALLDAQTTGGYR